MSCICCLLKRPMNAVLELWDKTYIYMNEPWNLNLANELWLLHFTCTLCCVFNELLIATWYCVEDICYCWCISYIGEPIEWYMLLVVLEDWSCDHILSERRLLRLPILLTAYFLCHCIIFKTWSWNIKIVTHLGRDCRPARLLFFYFSLSLL